MDPARRKFLGQILAGAAYASAPGGVFAATWQKINSAAGSAGTWNKINITDTAGQTWDRVGPAAVPPGPLGVGIYSGGGRRFSPSASYTATDKYTFSSDAREAGTALAVVRQHAAGAGNITSAITAGGYAGPLTPSVATSDKYTYAGDVRSAGANLGSAKAELGAAGNTSVGIFAGGLTTFNTPSTATAATNKYTYASDTRVAGTNLNAAQFGLTAAGNSTEGIFGCALINSGGIITTTLVSSKYTYSSDTRVNGSAFGLSRGNASAAGNGSLGIFAGGTNADGSSFFSQTEKYTYSTAIRAAGTALSAAKGNMGASGDATAGIFACGYQASGIIAAVDKYTYASAVRGAGTALGTARYAVSATSDSGNGLT